MENKKEVPNYLAAAMELEKDGKLEKFKKRLDAVLQDGNWQNNVDALLKEFGIEVIPAGKNISSGRVPSSLWIFKGIPSFSTNTKDLLRPLNPCPKCGSSLETLSDGGCGGKDAIYGCLVCDILFTQITGGIFPTPGGEEIRPILGSYKEAKAKIEKGEKIFLGFNCC
jgi:hypothetical protein